MFLLQFYRMYAAFLFGGTVYFLSRSILWSIATILCVRIVILLIERIIHRILINHNFARHEYAFKEMFGPYGIRMINKAREDRHTKESLGEVFTTSEKKLRKTVETLEMMDTLFKVGLQPDQEAIHLHDLKLKYAKHRLEG